jgi:hypothetical protein
MTLGRPLESPGISGARQQIAASWLESLGAFGVVVGFPSWTGNEPISRHPGGVPILDGSVAHDAFKAADLASLRNVLAAVINRAAFAGSMT